MNIFVGTARYRVLCELLIQCEQSVSNFIKNHTEAFIEIDATKKLDLLEYSELVRTVQGARCKVQSMLSGRL
jgi:uncharacterized protein YuzB (UPF0349 family)